MDAITEYQKWKQQGESLRMQAKQAMETRFRDLLLEAAQIAQEYHRDFGGALKPPASITTFRYKTTAGHKAKKPAVKNVAAKTPAPKSSRSQDRRPAEAQGADPEETRSGENRGQADAKSRRQALRS